MLDNKTIVILLDDFIALIRSFRLLNHLYKSHFPGIDGYEDVIEAMEKKYHAKC